MCCVLSLSSRPLFFAHLLPSFSYLLQTLPDAVNVFLRQSLRLGGFPFDVRLDRPNKDTAAAMLEAERLPHDPSVTRFSDVEEALRTLKR